MFVGVSQRTAQPIVFRNELLQVLRTNIHAFCLLLMYHSLFAHTHKTFTYTPHTYTHTCSVLFKRPISAVTSSFICCVGALAANDLSMSSSICCCGLRCCDGDGGGDRDEDDRRARDGDDDCLEMPGPSFSVFIFSPFLPWPRVGDFFLVDGCGIFVVECAVSLLVVE